MTAYAAVTRRTIAMTSTMAIPLCACGGDNDDLVPLVTPFASAPTAKIACADLATTQVDATAIGLPTTGATVVPRVSYRQSGTN